METGGAGCRRRALGRGAAAGANKYDRPSQGKTMGLGGPRSPSGVLSFEMQETGDPLLLPNLQNRPGRAAEVSDPRVASRPMTFEITHGLREITIRL